MYRWNGSRWYRNRWSDYPYYFDRVYSDLQFKMNMFRTFLSSIPKNRSDFVNDLEIPEDVLKPHIFNDFEESLISDSIVSGSIEECELRTVGGISTDSSLSLSRAMTDSDIDYDRYRRLKNRSADPFDDIKMAVEAFPPEYLESLQSFQSESSEPDRYRCSERPLHNEELVRRMARFFDEDCLVYEPDDPGLLDLEDALLNVDYKRLEADLASI